LMELKILQSNLLNSTSAELYVMDLAAV